jgi:hypothetical protein
MCEAPLQRRTKINNTPREKRKEKTKMLNELICYLLDIFESIKSA